MPEIILTSFEIDTVRVHPSAFLEDGVQKHKVQTLTYSVLGQDANHALHRFFHEEAGTVIYEGDPVDSIVIGMNVAEQQPVEVQGKEKLVTNVEQLALEV
jgi:hypothetical protein